MTCIVYRNGVLASDSWVLDVWTKIGVMAKIAKRETPEGNILIAASGNSGYCKAFIDWARGDGLTKWLDDPLLVPEMGKEDKGANGLLFMPDGACVRFDEGVPPYTLTGPFFAIGSGSWVAVGALHMGATAEEAVEAAMAWDVGTNGPVISVRHHD